MGLQTIAYYFEHKYNGVKKLSEVNQRFCLDLGVKSSGTEPHWIFETMIDVGIESTKYNLPVNEKTVRKVLKGLILDEKVKELIFKYLTELYLFRVEHSVRPSRNLDDKDFNRIKDQLFESLGFNKE